MDGRSIDDILDFADTMNFSTAFIVQECLNHGYEVQEITDYMFINGSVEVGLRKLRIWDTETNDYTDYVF